MIFLFCFDYWSPVVIHLFFSEVCSCRHNLSRPSRTEEFSSHLEVDQRKWESCVNEFAFKWVLLVFPFYKSMRPCFLLVSRCHFLKVLPLRPCPSFFHHQAFKVISLHTLHIQKCLYLSHVHIQLIVFHVIPWHFVLTWLLSLSRSRRGVLWRICVHGTGFCDCVGVGVSGPGVDGI